MDVLALLFPKRCVGCKKSGEYICPNCFGKIDMTPPTICAACGKSAIDGITHPGCRGKYVIDGVNCALAYKGLVKKLIYQYKFSPYLSNLTHTLGELFYESIIQQEPVQNILDHRPVFISVPMHKKRLRERGYNQAELLTKYLAKKMGAEYRGICSKIKETGSQVGRTEKDRRENIKGAFKIVDNHPLPENILLIDDVLTSGATMNEIANIFKRKGVKKVWGLALAHGE